MGLTFLSPWLLLGLSAVCIPIILHFTGKRRKKTVFFPSLKFLIEVQKRTVRKVKIFQILLLCVRILCLALLALLLARPVIRYAGRLLSNPGASTGAVFVLDNSPSLGYVEEGTPRFEKAKLTALKILDTITDGGSALLLLNPDTLPSPAMLNSSLAVVRGQIRNAALSKTGGDPGFSINEAFHLLRFSPEFNKEVFFLTDLQRTSFQNPVRVNLDKGMEERAKLYIVNFGSPDFNNLAVSEAGVSPGICAQGQDLEVHSTISNFSSTDRVVRVDLYIDGARKTEKIVSVRGNSNASVVFREISPSSGIHTGYVEIEPDALTSDDRHYFSFEVRRKLEVIFVLDDLSDESLKSTVYLATALNPHTGKIHSPFTVSFLSSYDLERASFEDCASVILFNLRQLSRRALERLSGYLRGGGSIIFFPGDRIDRSYYNSVLNKEYSIFPARVEELENPVQGFSSITLVDWRHPVFSKFQIPDQGDFSSAHFFKFWRLKPDSDSGASILASFENGLPFLIEKEYGKGKVMVFAGIPSSGWNDFFLQPVFVAFIHELIHYLLPAGTSISDINPLRSESDLTPVNPGKISSYFEGIQPVVLDSKNPGLIEEILLRRQGISLRQALVWFLLCLLLLESIMSNWFVSKERETAGV